MPRKKIPSNKSKPKYVYDQHMKIYVPMIRKASKKKNKQMAINA